MCPHDDGEFTTTFGAQTLNASAHVDVTVSPRVNRTGALAATSSDQQRVRRDPAHRADRHLAAASVTATAMADFGAVDMDAPSPTQMVRSPTTATPSSTSRSRRCPAAAPRSRSPAAVRRSTLAASGGQLTVTVTYHPTIEKRRPERQRGPGRQPRRRARGPTSSTITVQGRGIDRHIQVDAARRSRRSSATPATRPRSAGHRAQHRRRGAQDQGGDGH